MDICLIFSNAIENAINALTVINYISNRKLSIVCKSKVNKLHIEIINTFEGSVDFINEIPISTSENHGLGAKSIASITEKYGGVYSFSAENGIFKTRIII